MRSTGPAEFDGHGAPSTTGPEHHDALAGDRGHLVDRLDHALAIIVMPDQSPVFVGYPIRRPDHPRVFVDGVKERNRGDLVRHGDAVTAETQRASTGNGGPQVVGRDVALPELPVQPVMGIDGVEHAIDGILGHRMAQHSGHLLLGRQLRGHCKLLFEVSEDA